MSKKLFLHIGSPKTGTTSIQNMLANNRLELERQGYIYPGREACHHKFYFTTNQDSDLWPRQFRGIPFQALQEKVTRYLVSLAHDFQRDYETYIISTEYLFLDDEDAISNVVSFLSDFFSDIEIVVFVRCPVSFYSSSQQQVIKASSKVMPPCYYYYNFRDVIEAWERCLKVNVVGYKPGEDSFSKFCNIVGLAEASLDKYSNENSSLSLEQMLVLEKVQKNFYSNQDDLFKPHLGVISKVKMNGLTKPRLKESVKSFIYSKHLKDISWLCRNHGVDLSNDAYEKLVGAEDVADLERCSLRDVYVADMVKSDVYESGLIDILAKKVAGG